VSLRTLSRDIDRAVTLASNSIAQADRIDRRRLMDARDRLQRYHAALIADMALPCGGPFGTNGRWGENGLAPTVRDIIRTVEDIAQSRPGNPLAHQTEGFNSLERV
jgi:hypothetical protein